MGPLSYLEGFCVVQRNWQDFGEYRLERSKKLDIKTSSLLRSSTNTTTNVSQILYGQEVLVKSTCTVVKLNIVLFSVLFCVVYK